MRIVVDTSAIMAVLRLEPEAHAFARIMEEAQECLISSVTILETGIVAYARRGQPGRREFDAFLLRLTPTIVPFDADQARLARTAFERWGKGRHPASLNFGDCATYALARHMAVPLLFKGDDFTATDLDRAS